jgi:hypothetical protein
MNVQIHRIRFAVNETPYCFWSLDPIGQDLEFINNIDPRYFEHIAELHGDSLEDDQKQYAAAAIRIAHSQGLETLFALLCAVAQAPDCVIGWFLKYQNRDLYDVVKKINEGETIYKKLRSDIVTWNDIAEVVFSSLKTGDDEKDKAIRTNFARLWRRFASDFLDKQHELEYNSIKHGLRAKLGGFYLAIGAEDTPGVPAPAERMRLFGSSEFGSSFFVPERLHNARNFSIRHQALNWSPENFLYALRLISISMDNVLGFLKIFHGVPATNVNFSWPSDNDTYNEPWLRTSGITRMAMNSPISEGAITPLTKDEILSVYKEDIKAQAISPIAKATDDEN